MSSLTELCGNIPEDFKKIDISSNPNFIFEVDPNFNSVILYNVDGNPVQVNSFTECEHYFSGGWNLVDFNKSEILAQNALTIFLAISIFFYYLIKSKKKKFCI